MTRVHLPVSTTYVHAWVEVAVGSISLAPRGFHPDTTVFPLFKEQYFQIPIRPGMADEAEPPCGSATLFSLFKRNFHVPTPLRFHRLNAGASDA